MANSWLRLWHDMPNDPKWRTIARASKQSISAVMAVYVHVLVNASNASERGRTQNVCSEDIASALDLDTEQIDCILAAMQGRVLDGDMVSGWQKRQVEREDGSAERSKRWRDAQKEEKQTQPNATERKQTPDKDKDTDKDKDKSKSKTSAAFALPDWVDRTTWDLWLKTRKGKKMIPEQMQAQVDKLAKWRGEGLDYAKALADAAGAGWQGLFEPKSPVQVPGRAIPKLENFAEKNYGTGVTPL